MKTNRLINSTSPYLLQHAHNPVDWYEWSEEALSRARRENRPILVSIGYSSCHWCHVMEREVFEKDDIAAVMNEHLICIKVDREERPDIDSIYMEAVQAMGVNGGWPLNVFLTPDQKPFYGGTYFPPDQWLNVIHAIHRGFTERRDEVNASANELATMLANQDTSHFKKVYEFKDLRTELDKMFEKLSATFDKAWGGLEKAPKFIMPSVWLWLLRYHHVTGNENALQHLRTTLQRIAWGGIYDQIGGGFARYSVDQYWFVPHFEKMLYDNAQLLSLYAEGFAATGDSQFRRIVTETFEWLQSEMMHPDGAFYSALDADSEGVEGKFYVWKKEDVDRVLEEESAAFCDFYNVKPEGNWEHGNSVLIRTQPDEAFLAKHKMTADDWAETLQRCKDKLLAERDIRIRPGLDDKVVTAWNAMTICGLVDAYKYVGDDRFLQAALKTMQFIENELTEGTVLFRSYKGRRSGTRGFLDDYAYVIQACIRLYQVTFDEYWARRAEMLTNYTLEHFHDPDDGFFFYTSRDGEPLIARRKEIFDNVIPASNSVMVQNLYHLGCLLDRERWKQLAESMTTPLAHLIIQEPNYMSNWGLAYTEIKRGMAEVVFAGDDKKELLRKLFSSYEPFALTIGGDKEKDNFIPLAAGKSTMSGKPTIYVCYNNTCLRPVHDVEEAIQQIRTSR